MATIRREIALTVEADSVWAKLADFGAVHKKVAPEFVISSRMDGDARVLTFANGTSARELLVSSDAAARRLVYSVAPNERISHHNASVEVVSDGHSACRLVWLVDLLPDQIASYVAGQMDAALVKMKPALERRTQVRTSAED
jgi:hypothetical protein